MVIRYQTIVVGACVGKRIKGFQAKLFIALPPAILPADHATIQAGVKFRSHAGSAAFGPDLDPVTFANASFTGGLRMHADFRFR